MHLYLFYGSTHLFELLQTTNVGLNFIQRSLVKAWKGYHLNGAIILKPKAEKDLEVSKCPVLQRKIKIVVQRNIKKMMTKSTNSQFCLFVNILPNKYTQLSDLFFVGKPRVVDLVIKRLVFDKTFTYCSKIVALKKKTVEFSESSEDLKRSNTFQN